MQCTEFRDYLFDLMAGEGVPPEVKAHLLECQGCASEMAAMNSTMALLDEWKAPEDTSPYFMTRLRARIREEAGKEVKAGWLSWFRKPALAISMALLFLVSLTLFQTGDDHVREHQNPKAVTASAANDLQYLDKYNDVLQNLELLDDLGNNNNSQSTVNP
jgi:hypothetical protein